MGRCKHCLRSWVLLDNDPSSLLSISVHVQREEWATKRQQCSTIQGRQAHGDSHGLRVMSEALRLKANKGAPNVTNKARRSSAALALALLVLSEVL